MSVVIPCHNDGVYLPEALDSVGRSTLEDIEIIIVDDGSTDEQTKFVLEHLKANGHVVLEQENRGLPAARNAGVSIAHAPYVLCLDADDRIAPTYLEKALWVFERNPGVGFVTAWVRRFGLDDSPWRPPAPTVENMRRGNCAISGSPFRRVAWSQVSGFDEELAGEYEDYDFWLKLLEAGWRGFQIREELYYYRVKEQSMFVNKRLKHARVMETLRKRHPGIFRETKPSLVARVGDRFRSTRLGRLLVRVFPRDTAAIRDHGLVAWVKWRVYAVARYIPPALHVYRAIRDCGKRRASLEMSAGQPASDLAGIQIRQGRLPCIVFGVPWLEMGGADKVNLDLLRGLNGRWRPVVVTTLCSDHSWHDEFSRNVDEVFHLGNMLDSEEERLFLLKHIFRSRNVRLLFISNSMDMYRWLPEIKDTFGVPVVSLTHTYVPSDPWDYVRVSAQLDKYIDVHITVSPDIFPLVRHGAKQDKIVFLPNGVDLDLFHRREKDVTLRKFGLPVRPHVCTFLGRLTREKNPLFFLRIADAIRRMRDDALFVVAGDGEMRSAVLDAMRKLRLQGALWWIGPLSEKEAAEILGATDVLVAPSLYESMPIVGLEAMASEAVVVASRIPGWENIIVDGATGFLCKLDESEFVERILKVLKAPSQREALGKSARRYVTERHDIRQITSAYEKIFRRLVASSDNS